MHLAAIECYLLDDLSQLRAEYPSWRFGSHWATAASGPDRRRLWATRDGVTVTAWDAAALRAEIVYEDRQMETGGA
jgi:hypothetical protein